MSRISGLALAYLHTNGCLPQQSLWLIWEQGVERKQPFPSLLLSWYLIDLVPFSQHGQPMLFRLEGVGRKGEPVLWRGAGVGA